MNDLEKYCPKCGAEPGQPCRSVKHDGPMRSSRYATHKRRRNALSPGWAAVLRSKYGQPSTESAGQRSVPVRLSSVSRPQVGRVDSAVKSRDR